MRKLRRGILKVLLVFIGIFGVSSGAGAFTISSEYWEVDEVAGGGSSEELGQYFTITYNVYNYSNTYSLVAFGVGLSPEIYDNLLGEGILSLRKDWVGMTIESEEFEMLEEDVPEGFSGFTFKDLFGDDYSYAVMLGATYTTGEGDLNFVNPIGPQGTSTDEFVLAYTYGVPSSPVAAAFYNPDTGGFFVSVGQTGVQLPTPISPVPEPASLLLLGSGVVGLLFFRRKS